MGFSGARSPNPVNPIPEPWPARVLSVDLTELERSGGAPCVEGWAPGDPVLARLAAWGGSALAVALFVEEARRFMPQSPESIPLVLSVGNAVRRGVPTAARLTVASRGALTGRFSEGQIGGDCASRLARLADALVVRGRASRPGAVLEIDAAGGLQLHSMASLAGLPASETRRSLAERFGQAAALYVGPGGERGVRFATLISGLDRASHVGRGGLGAAFGRLGLKALVFSGPPIVLPSLADGPRSSIVAALVSSPRLRARAEGGTHELWSAFQARGELRGRNYSQELTSDDAERLWRESRDAASERHGCAGCPTPCGWVFERADRKQPTGPRFGAALALGPNLGFDHLDPALGLFSACDEAGIDAKETGAVLALLMRARELGRLEDAPAWGEVGAAELVIARLLDGPSEARTGALGAAALARVLDLEGELFAVKGQSVRPDHDLASLLGQCVSSNGADPMRSFPFATADGLDGERIQELLAPVGLPTGAEDAEDPRGAGRLVWWHENFVAAVDASGFCSFSAGGLVSDGVAELDQLACWIAPPSQAPESSAETLLELGAAIVWLRRELAARWGAQEAEDRPGWARQKLELPGMLDEYRLARGLDAAGSPREEAARSLAAGELFAFGREQLQRADAAAPAVHEEAHQGDHGPRGPGQVHVRGTGPLGDRLGGPIELRVELPASVGEVLAALVRLRPEVASSVLHDGRPLAAVYRDGERLGSGARVRPGDLLDLVVAVSGG